MINIRQGVFETNSSSTHSICVAKESDEIDIPKNIHFAIGEFGWEINRLSSIEEKASYLYTGLMANKMEKEANDILDYLKSLGIKVTAEEVKYDKYGSMNGYVDHSDALVHFLDALSSDYNKLCRFLFSPLSFILTGNDNDDCSVCITVDYPHDKFYKGN